MIQRNHHILILVLSANLTGCYFDAALQSTNSASIIPSPVIEPVIDLCSSKVQLSSVSPSTIQPGDNVTIQGQGFADTPNLKIYVGDSVCKDISIISNTQAQCKVDSSVGGYVDVLGCKVSEDSPKLESKIFQYMTKKVVDNGTNLNFNPAHSSYIPRGVIHNSKLHACWLENNKTRVAVNNGTHDAPNWQFLDGANTNGINRDPARASFDCNLVSVNSRLFLFWTETTGTAYVGRLLEYNGTPGSWTIRDDNSSKGLNVSAARNADYLNCIPQHTNIYCAWRELAASNGMAQTRVGIYNTTLNSWSLIDGGGNFGLNFNSNYHVGALPGLVFINNKLYVTWAERNGTNVNQIRVKVYDGTSWSFIDGGGVNGLNKDPLKSSTQQTMIHVGDYIYIAWQENNSTHYSARVIRYKHNDTNPEWKFIDGNNDAGVTLNAGLTRAAFTNLIDSNGKINLMYVDFQTAPNQMRIASWNGDAVSPIWTHQVLDASASSANVNSASSVFVSTPPAVVRTEDGNGFYGIWPEGVRNRAVFFQ